MASTHRPPALSKTEFEAYNARIQAAALTATRSSAGLPSDIAFHRSVDRDFAKELDACSERVLSVTNRLLSLVSTAGSSKSTSGKGKAKLEDQDDFTDRFESVIVESMDQLLERADICLDQFSGRSKAPAIAIHPSLPEKPKRPAAASGRLEPVIQHAYYLPKPQLKFKRKIDYANGLVWYPTLKHKYNAQVPLGYNLHPNDNESELSLPPHPYRHEISNISHPPHMFKSHAPIPPKSFSETPFTWVSTSSDLAAMLDKLRTSQEIAIDLEYHSYRTFSGFVCLMQISSREEDWIVDTLELRDELEDLNEVLTNPNIVKVLHGAESDVVWLQQDFNLYIINLFDTFHASKVLDFPRHGLATLLEMYCDFTADKRYQLADWRIRPLPEEMLKYARSDTHFLLYIYDNLRNALLDRSLSRAQSPSAASTSRSQSPATDGAESLLREVLARSAETALRVYEREFYDAAGGSGPSGWDTMAKKWNKLALMAEGPGGEKLEVYKAVHGWRDRIAREQDESTRYVLSNHFLFRLAEQPPADMAALLGTFQSVPPIIRRRAKDLLDDIRNAIKRAAKSVAEAPKAIAAEVEVETSIQSETMDVDERPAPAPGITVESRLWSRSTISHSASSSALLGPSVSRVSESKAASYTAVKSVLFGHHRTSITTVTSSTSISSFQDVMKQIHSALNVAPKIPQLADIKEAVEVSETPAAAETPSTSEPPAPGVEELAFVPSSQRQPAPIDAVDDSIVVVGQRQKKRKRSKKTDADDAAPSGPADVSAGKKAKKGKAAAEDVVPYDYSTAPNILDDQPVTEGAKAPRKKQKKTRGGGIEFGNFPAPPRDRTQVKSGNQSQTFR